MRILVIMLLVVMATLAAAGSRFQYKTPKRGRSLSRPRSSLGWVPPLGLVASKKRYFDRSDESSEDDSRYDSDESRGYRTRYFARW